MKKVNFSKITIKNFLSIGNDPVVLDFTPGIHIVTGINQDEVGRRNAVGKTSLIESIYFAIFGSTLRDIKKDLIPNTHTNGTCEVVLDFNVEESNRTDSYQVIRTLNPSKLHLFKNGVNVTRDSIKNTEEELQAALSASPSIFENCVIMTLNNTTPFMGKSKVDKRKFIEGIFNLGIFSQMLSTARDDYSDNKRLFELTLSKFEDSKRNLTSLNTQKQSVIAQRADKIEKYEARKLNNINEKLKIQTQLDNYKSVDTDKLTEDIKKLTKALNDCATRIDTHKSTIVSNATTVKHLKETCEQIGTDHDKCPVCLRSIEDNDAEHIKNEKQKIESKINELVTISKNIKLTLDKDIENNFKFKSAIDKLQDKISNDQLQQHKKATYVERLKQLNEWLEQLDGDIEVLKDSKTDLDVVVQDVESRQVIIKKELDEHKQQLNLLDTVKYIVSEEGVKSYIVNRILELFNNILAHYLAKMNAKCMCFFNEYFEEEVINEKKKIWSYFNLSGAERKNIDFACLFTFIDMRRLQGNVTYNISIYDELFDSSLDEKGVDLVTDILKERVEKYDECVFVISHRKESIKHGTADTIFLEKKNGITRRLDYNPFTDN